MDWKGDSFGDLERNLPFSCLKFKFELLVLVETLFFFIMEESSNERNLARYSTSLRRFPKIGDIMQRVQERLHNKTILELLVFVRNKMIEDEQKTNPRERFNKI